MFEAYGIRVSSERDNLYGFRLRGFVIASLFDRLNKNFSFFFFFGQLPLLKALIDRLLQDGIEELLQVLGTAAKQKDKTETHTSNVITEYTVCKLSHQRFF